MKYNLRLGRGAKNSLLLMAPPEKLIFSKDTHTGI
jgi:hypothetical protein